MNYTSTSGDFIKYFLPSFNKCKLKDGSKNKIKDIAQILYNDIYQANKEVIKKGCFTGKLKKLTTSAAGPSAAGTGTSAAGTSAAGTSAAAAAKKPEIYNSRFFPSYIKKYINDHEKYQLTYTCKIQSRIIHIHFTLFTEEALLHLDDTYLTCMKMIYIWLKIAASYSSKMCAKTLDIYIYQTPFTKELPKNATTTLGVEQVNTAFTMSCAPEGEIVIFRNEEWFKVLLHETFHAYGLDAGANNTKQLNKYLSTLFPIDSGYDVTEAYAETWARIMNAAFCSFNALEKKEDVATFLTYFDFNLQLERIFSLYQCNKVLGFMGLTYKNIHEGGEKNAYLRKNLYRENTHVFAYYILTSIFLNNYNDFLSWCNEHNTSFFTIKWIVLCIE